MKNLLFPGIALGLVTAGILVTIGPWQTNDLAGVPRSKEAVPAAFREGDIVHQLVEVTTKPNAEDNVVTVTEDYWIAVGDGGELDKVFVRVIDSTGYVLQEAFYDSHEEVLSNYTVRNDSGRSQLVISNRTGYSPWIGWSDHDISQANGYVSTLGSLAGHDVTVLSKVEQVDNLTMSHTIEIARDLGVELASRVVVTGDTGEVLSLYSRETALLEVASPGSVPPGIFDWEAPAAAAIIDNRLNTQ